MKEYKILKVIPSKNQIILNRDLDTEHNVHLSSNGLKPFKIILDKVEDKTYSFLCEGNFPSPGEILTEVDKDKNRYKVLEVNEDRRWFILDQNPSVGDSLLRNFTERGDYLITHISEDKCFFKFYAPDGKEEYDVPKVGEILYFNNIFSESLVGQGIIGFEPIGSWVEVEDKNYLWTKDMERNIGKYGCILDEEKDRVLIKFGKNQYWYPKTFEIFFYLVKNNNRPQVKRKHKIININKWGSLLFEDRNIYKGERLICSGCIIEVTYVDQVDFGSRCSVKFITEDKIEFTEGQEWKKVNI